MDFDTIPRRLSILRDLIGAKKHGNAASKKAADALLVAARGETAVRTGQLRDSLQIEKLNGQIGLGVRDPYDHIFRFVTQGTAPRRILTKRYRRRRNRTPQGYLDSLPRALKIGDGFFGAANHPGTAANPFVRRAIRKHGRNITAAATHGLLQSITRK